MDMIRSPWTSFVYSDASISGVFSFSSDKQMVTCTQTAAATTASYLGFRIIAQAGDVVAFDVDVDMISGHSGDDTKNQCIMAKCGSEISSSKNVMKRSARANVCLPDEWIGLGFRTVHLETKVPESKPTQTVWCVVGAAKNSMGTARYKNPKVYINGKRLNTGMESPEYIISSSEDDTFYETRVYDQDLTFSTSANGRMPVNSPFYAPVNGTNSALKIIGTNDIQTMPAIHRYECDKSDDTPGLIFYRSMSGVVGQHSKAPEGTCFMLEAYDDNGTSESKVMSIRANNFTENGHRNFAISLPDASGEKDKWGLQVRSVTGSMCPMSDNYEQFGYGSLRWKEIFAATATVNTSDERLKDNIIDPDEGLMRAWGKVNFKVFQFKDAIEQKGEDARLHIGVIAQQVQEAFASEGLDASRYGLFCHDAWDNEYETDKDGNQVVVREAGDSYGIRYEEALALECAYQRWLGAKREARLTLLEHKLNEGSSTAEEVANADYSD